MIVRTSRKLRLPLLGAAAAALALTTTTALAGSGVGGVFNLGVVNTVDGQTSLTGNPGASPLLKVTSTGTAAAVRGVATNGIGTNGVSTSGVGQQGLSDSGTGTLGTHGNTTGVSPGVQGETNSNDPNGAGVVGKNNGGGPGLKSIVLTGAPPLAVNSSVKVTNLNADLLDGFDSLAFQKRVTGTCAAGSAVRTVNADGTVVCEPVGGGGVWSLTGNSGTTPGTNFLGTTDNQALEFKVNGQRALRLEPTCCGAPNVIGGIAGNSVLAGAEGATIAGGGDPTAPNSVTVDGGAVGGGRGNTASAIDATIAGGSGNTASGGVATVSGGINNAASALNATVSGGSGNTADGSLATVAGGQSNTAKGSDSIVAGGSQNAAIGTSSFAAGFHATAQEDGSFVWNDFSGNFLSSNGANTVSFGATGGARFVTAYLAGNPSAGVTLASGGGSWASLSDRAAKRNFVSVDRKTLLAKLDRIPVSSWSYKSQSPSIRHLGPMAQDFSSAFGLGEDNRHIDTIDSEGVALAAIQGLYRQNQALERQNQAVERQNRALDGRLTRLERVVAGLEH